MTSPEMKPVQAAKALMRKNIANILDSMSSMDRLRQSRQVQQMLFDLPEWENAKRVSVYLSMDQELSTDEIAQTAIVEGKELFIPICRQRKMRMLKIHDFSDLDNLPRNSWGIREPVPIAGREDALESGGLDLIITPGVAFTSQGLRLGHGAGYYDTFFTELSAHEKSQNLKAHTSIALAFKQQILADVPVTVHDIRVDRVLYPSE